MGVLSYLLGSLTGVSPASHADNKTPTTTAPTSASVTATSPSPPATPPRQGQGQQPSSPPPPPDQPPQIDYYHHYFSARSLKQLTLFLGGAGCFYLSVMISRRAAIRHQLAARLKFYEPNNQFAWRSGSEKDALPPTKKDPLIALEALNLATLNTMAFAIMAAGGASWALDIANVEDLRRYARRSIVQAGGERDEAAEREVAEWMVSTFGLGEGKGLEGEKKRLGEGEKKRLGEGEKKGLEGEKKG
ncbi:hypothetical protein B0I37DRAFT_442013 [Chaetomium sp. MPI-CAGE-AT-0009]|nr:hypothetical protein B0I37DRAFT_442013 [Chaetomium sp. MPI-CAGE-AT-0009]